MHLTTPYASLRELHSQMLCIKSTSILIDHLLEKKIRIQQIKEFFDKLYFLVLKWMSKLRIPTLKTSIICIDQIWCYWSFFIHCQS